MGTPRQPGLKGSPRSHPVEQRLNPAEAHPTKTGEQSERSSGEEAARRERVQQEDGPKPSSRDQNRRGQRDQDDGGQSGQVGRDQNSR